MQINVRWTHSLRSYQFGTVPLDLDVWRSLEALYERTDAGAYGFLLQDPADSVVPSSIGRVTLISASDNTYQLVERKTAAGSILTHDRTITRPRASGFILYLNGVPSGSYTLDDTTGIITIPSAPDVSVVKWSGLTYVPVHFDSDEIDWDLVISAYEPEARLFAGPTVTLEEVREA